jgi:anti-sigma B factor antagonist
MQISCRRHDKVTIFDLSGDIDFANSRRLRESVLRKIQENRTSHVMVNLSAVRYIDSSGIASLVGALKALRDRGTRLILFGPVPIREVLQLSRLIKVFEIYGNEEQALRWALRLRSQGITIQPAKPGNSGPTGDAMTSTGTTPTCRIHTLRKERAL